MVYDLIIVGGGPAGVSAGLYAARQNIKILLITKGFGGQLSRKAVTIDNYPGLGSISGVDLIRKFENHLREQKVKIEIDSAAKIKKTGDKFTISTGGKNNFEAKTVLVTSGADPRPLEVVGEKKFIGKGVSYCAVCDGPLFAGKTAAIIGGGNAGFETAIFLSNIAKKIYILEYSEKIGADSENQGIVKKTGKTEIIAGVALKEIRGGRFVEQIIYQNRKTKKNVALDVQGVFVEIGSQPATAFVKDLVDFSEKDEIVVDSRTCQTKTPGLFAAGDVTNSPFKQIVIAAGQGAQAALSIFNYLQKL